MNDPTANIRSNTSLTHQYLTFFVAGEEYGVDILRVQEIRGWTKEMPIPQAPPYVKGVINIRGDIVPIADLRERLGLSKTNCDKTTAIVVLRVRHEDQERVMGIVVDAMSDVTNVAADSIKPPPQFGGQVTTGLAQGIVTQKDKMITILNVDHIVPAPTTSSPMQSSDSALSTHAKQIDGGRP